MDLNNYFAMASGDDNSSLVSDEDIDWEEVDVPQHNEQQNIEITLQTRPKQKKQDKSDKSVPIQNRFAGTDIGRSIAEKQEAFPTPSALLE